MLDLLIKGGVVLWTIMLLSVVALAIVVERFLYFRRIRTDEEEARDADVEQPRAERHRDT